MQTINLRKANVVQSEVRKLISVAIKDTLTVTEFTLSITDALEKAKIDFSTEVTRKVALNTALFNIRKSVAQANANSGISEILTDIELIDAKLNTYNSITSKEAAKSFDELRARVEKLKVITTERSSIYGDRFNSVETSVVEQGTIDAAKQIVKELKREKQTLQDKLLSLNVNTLITISDVDEMVLKLEGIL